VEVEDLSADFVIILRYLCEVLASSRSAEHVEPLILEGILIMLHGVPPNITKSTAFHDIVWSVLISLPVSLLSQQSHLHLSFVAPGYQKSQ